MHRRKLVVQMTLLILIGISPNAEAFENIPLISMAFPGLIIGMLLALSVEALAWTRKSSLGLWSAIKKLGFVYFGSLIVYILFIILWIRAINNGVFMEYIGLGDNWGILPIEGYKPSVSEIIYSITLKAVWFNYIPTGYKWLQFFAILVSILPLYIITVLITKVRVGREEILPKIIKTKLLYIVLIFVSITTWLLITEPNSFFAV